MIVVEAMGGLANRIRGAVSGLILGEELGEQVVVVWRRKPGTCAAAHHEIFADSDPATFVSELEPAGDEKLWRLRWKRGERRMFGRPLKGDSGVFEIPRYVLRARTENVRIRTHWNFRGPGTPIDRYDARYSELLQRHFRPLEEERFSTPPSHGMHIRRGDMTRIPRQRLKGGASNPARCLRAMRRVLEADPSASFLLCSDDRSVKERVHHVLGDRVRLLEGPSADRDSPSGLRFAARELHALGQVGTILGDGRSTFGPTAARYRNVPYVNLMPMSEQHARRWLARGQRLARDWLRNGALGRAARERLRVD